VAGGLYHVIQRGNNRQLIFFEDEDRRAFLDRLERGAQDCACRVHAYCLMSNHVHLLVQTDRPNLSVFGQRLFGGYAKRINHHHRRSGHLFQGRFTSAPIAEDPSLLQVSRYIHLNPVAARMVKRPEDYPWSSLRAYLPRARGPAWVHTATTLAYFHGSRQRYLAFVREGVTAVMREAGSMGDEGGALLPEPMPAVPGSVVRSADAGSRDQRDGAPAELVEGILQEVARVAGVEVAWLQRKHARQPRVAQAKAQAVRLLRERTALTLEEIGQALGAISPSAVAWHLHAPVSAPRLLNKLNA